MKTTEEIHELIQNCPDEGNPRTMVILEHINNKLAELEQRLDEAEGTARHASNVAGCLANGILPD